MKLSKLKYNPENPRRISPEQLDKLVKSIESLPKMMELRPIVYDPNTMYVLGGNQRLAALRKMGKTEIPDNWVKSTDEMTDKEKREFILRDNVQAGEWDFGVLEENFADFDLDDIGIELPDSFGIDEPEVTEDDYKQPEQIDTDIKLGDLFSLRKDGKEIHRLLCGDATKKEDVDRLMGGARVGLCFTDPPYGIGKEGIANDELDGETFYNFSKAYSSVIPAEKDCGMVCYHSTRTFYHSLNAFLAAGWKFEKMLFFYRPDKMPVHTWNGWMMTSQAIMLFSVGEPGYVKISPAHQDVYRITSTDLTEGRVLHPTVKPISNCSDLISHYASTEVYDCFLGSGSTMVACHQLNRKCYGMEIEPTYCQVTLDRMLKLDPDIEVVKIGGGE